MYLKMMHYVEQKAPYNVVQRPTPILQAIAAVAETIFVTQATDKLPSHQR